MSDVRYDHDLLNKCCSLVDEVQKLGDLHRSLKNQIEFYKGSDYDQLLVLLMEAHDHAVDIKARKINEMMKMTGSNILCLRKTN